MNTDKILAEAIAKDYAPKDNSKIVALKKLDKKAKLPATIFTYTFGIISALIYKRMLERDKSKYAYEIVELAREISEEK